MPSSHALTLTFRDTRYAVITTAVAEMRTSSPPGANRSADGAAVILRCIRTIGSAKSCWALARANPSQARAEARTRSASGSRWSHLEAPGARSSAPDGCSDPNRADGVATIESRLAEARRSSISEPFGPPAITGRLRRPDPDESEDPSRLPSPARTEVSAGNGAAVSDDR